MCLTAVRREIGEFHSGWPCARRRDEAGQEGCPNGGGAPRTVPVAGAGGHTKCPCFWALAALAGSA